jgi:hypothetical protein
MCTHSFAIWFSMLFIKPNWILQLHSSQALGMHTDTLITKSYLFVLTWKVSTVAPFRVPFSHSPTSCKGTQPHMIYSIPLTHLVFAVGSEINFLQLLYRRIFYFLILFKIYQSGIKVRKKASYCLIEIKVPLTSISLSFSLLLPLWSIRHS